jgi:hypothetical protein
MSSVDTLELDCVWRAVCAAYDITAARPEAGALLEGADLSAPRAAAAVVLLNMLSEVPEHIGRFSPWYRLPARAFGLMHLRSASTGRARWLLAPEAEFLWQDHLAALETAIRQNVGLLLASEWVDSLIVEQEYHGLLARCACEPPRLILIEASALGGRGIVCHTCRRPFHSLSDSSPRRLED